ncbi:peptidoglycan recognition protein family protein [Simiaoa sp.]|uniref:peptidoglycan recognition protein family protein n=1 Tax=Simiaoa sp. TaxID=2944202 RepID=UPI003F7FCCB2
MTQENRSSRQAEIHITQMRRNPYLVDYQTGKNTSRHTGRHTEQSQHSTPAMSQEGTRTRTYPQHSVAPRQEDRHRLARAERQRRRRRARIRRYIRMTLLSACILVGIIALTKLLRVPASTAEASTPLEAIDTVQQVGKEIENTTGTGIQGLSAETYAAHPDWTEDFLTVNEYSRPGDPLTEVNNIFVHYTANPGTSAAQNRSYFEQLKDNHERSASAHFIIGYNGEIIQCVPLDEIAYAVQTRNEDSISIECCYKADNGQFTQETYDSLIKLLKWLIDAYDLQPDDILRHYDCGGKKCPIYYTEHEDAWDRLKEDVKNL